MKQACNLLLSFINQVWRVPTAALKKRFAKAPYVSIDDLPTANSESSTQSQAHGRSGSTLGLIARFSSTYFKHFFIKTPVVNRKRSTAHVTSIFQRQTVQSHWQTQSKKSTTNKAAQEFSPSRENMTAQGRYYSKHLSLPKDSTKQPFHPNPLERYQHPTLPLSWRGWLKFLTPLAAAVLLLVLMVVSLPNVYAAEPQGGAAVLDDLNKFGIPAVQYQATDTGGEYSVTIQILAIMTLLSVIPALIILMTSFTRIIVVLAILRQAIGLQQTPSNQILLGLSLFLTLFVMMPIFRMINVEAVQPYLDESITSQQALDRALIPIHEFMLGQTREDDLQLFMRISGETNIPGPEQTPLHILIPAFITSELKTAFQIGFLIFIPFLIIDLVVASILMAMGMMMLSPIIISLPFKIMLFVLIDGWAMIMGTLANSFGTI